MFTEQGFGAKFVFDTVGVNKLGIASTAIAGMATQIDKAVVANNKFAESLSLAAAGAVGIYATKKIKDFGKKVYSVGADIEEAITILHGKLLDMSDTDFNKLVQQLRYIGIVTEYSDAEVIKTADTLRAMGTASEDLAKVTEVALGFATATGIAPDTAASIIKTALNVFNEGADAAERYADAMINARNTTILASSSQGMEEFQDFFKNVAMFSPMMDIAIEEMMLYAIAGREVGLTAERAGQYLGMLGRELFLLSTTSRTEQLDAIAAFGVTFRDVTGKLLPFTTIFEQLHYGYEKIAKTNRELADKYLADLFTRTTLGAFAMFNQAINTMGMETWQKTKIELSPEINTGAMRKQWGYVLDTAKGMMKVVGGAIESILGTIGTNIIEMIKPALKFVSDTVANIASVVSAPENAAIMKVIVSIASAITALIGTASAISLVLGLLGLVKATMPLLASGFAMFSAAMVKFLPIVAVLVGVGFAVYVLWDEIRAVFNVLKKYVDKNKDSFLALSKTVKDLFLPVAKSAIVEIKALFEAIATLVHAIGHAIVSFVRWMDSTVVGHAILTGLNYVVGTLLVGAFVLLGTIAVAQIGKIIAKTILLNVAFVKTAIAFGVNLIKTTIKYIANLFAMRTATAQTSFSISNLGITAGTASIGIGTFGSVAGTASVGVGALATSVFGLELALGLVLLAIAAVITVIAGFSKQAEYFEKGTTGSKFWDEYCRITFAASDFIFSIIDRIVKAFNDSIAWISNAFTNTINWIVGAFNDVKDFFVRIGDSISNVFDSISEAIKAAFDSAIDRVTDKYKKFLNFFIDKYNYIARFFGMDQMEKLELSTTAKTEVARPISAKSKYLPYYAQPVTTAVHSAMTIKEPSQIITSHPELIFNSDIRVSGDISPDQVNVLKNTINKEIRNNLRLASEIL